MRDGESRVGHGGIDLGHWRSGRGVESPAEGRGLRTSMASGASNLVMRPDAGMDSFRLVAALMVLRRARGASRVMLMGTPRGRQHDGFSGGRLNLCLEYRNELQLS